MYRQDFSLFRSMPEHASAQAIANKCKAFVREIREDDFSFASDGGLCSVTNLRSEKNAIERFFHSSFPASSGLSLSVKHMSIYSYVCLYTTPCPHCCQVLFEKYCKAGLWTKKRGLHIMTCESPGFRFSFRPCRSPERQRKEKARKGFSAVRITGCLCSVTSIRSEKNAIEHIFNCFLCLLFLSASQRPSLRLERSGPGSSWREKQKRCP